MTGTEVLQDLTVKLNGILDTAVAVSALVMAGGSQLEASTVTEEGAEVTTVLWGLVALAVAVLVTDPASTSPWVTV
jgi:hypothetical protein